MKQQPNDPRIKKEYHQPPLGPAENNSENAMGREGGDDSLADARPTDDRADEKVIVNTQEAQQAVNQPSQSELGSNCQDVVYE